MKQVTTFSASEIVAAVSLYNSAVRAIGNENLKQLTVKSVLEMVRGAKDDSTQHAKASINVTITGDIVVTYELETEAVLKTAAILEKYISPIIHIGKGVWSLVSGLKPLLKGLEYDINRTFTYDGADAVLLVSVRKDFKLDVEAPDTYTGNMYHVTHGSSALSNLDTAIALAEAAAVEVFKKGELGDDISTFEVHFVNDEITKVAPRS